MRSVFCTNKICSEFSFPLTASFWGFVENGKRSGAVALQESFLCKGAARGLENCKHPRGAEEWTPFTARSKHNAERSIATQPSIYCKTSPNWETATRSSDKENTVVGVQFDSWGDAFGSFEFAPGQSWRKTFCSKEMADGGKTLVLKILTSDSDGIFFFSSFLPLPLSVFLFHFVLIHPLGRIIFEYSVVSKAL